MVIIPDFTADTRQREKNTGKRKENVRSTTVYIKDSEKAAALQKQKEAHKEEIAHLEERIQEKQKQKEKLEREISEKYQKYIDRKKNLCYPMQV